MPLGSGRSSACLAGWPLKLTDELCRGGVGTGHAVPNLYVSRAYFDTAKRQTETSGRDETTYSTKYIQQCNCGNVPSTALLDIRNKEGRHLTLQLEINWK